LIPPDFFFYAVKPLLLSPCQGRDAGLTCRASNNAIHAIDCPCPRKSNAMALTDFPTGARRAPEPTPCLPNP
jgi:hypothetical protein